jgi:hypothetical protein
MMLEDFFDLPWGHDPTATTPGYQRTRLLAIWAGKGTAAYDWAVHALLEKVECAERDCGPEFRMVFKDNLDELRYSLASRQPCLGLLNQPAQIGLWKSYG